MSQVEMGDNEIPYSERELSGIFIFCECVKSVFLGEENFHDFAYGLQ